MVCALTVSIAAVALPVVVAPSARAVVLPPAPVNPDPAVRVLSDPGPTFITAHITEDTVWGPVYFAQVRKKSTMFAVTDRDCSVQVRAALILVS